MQKTGKITAEVQPQNELEFLRNRLRELEEENAIIADKEKRLRLLISSIEDYAIFMLHTKGYIATWNEGAQRIKGYTADEIIGKHMSVFYPKTEVITGKPVYELKIARTEGKYEEEGWRVRKNGAYFWANVLITAIK